MKVPKFRAKSLKYGIFVEGFYFQMPETTYCFEEDYKNFPVDTRHFLVIETMVDWGLPNQARLIEIDKSTLEQIGEVEI